MTHRKYQIEFHRHNVKKLPTHKVSQNSYYAVQQSIPLHGK